MNKIEQIANSDFIITFGTMLADNKEQFRDSIIEAIAKNDTQFIYMHPVDNIDLKLYYNQFIKYEVGSEEGVCAMLLDSFVKSSNEKIQNYIDDLDLGYISAESSAGEEEFEELLESSQNFKNKTLIIGDDLVEHERIDNIVKFLSVIKKYSSLNLVVLNEILEEKINACDDENLDEVEDLKSYD
jgi:NADH-quinone oxidoreductase subunit F